LSEGKKKLKWGEKGKAGLRFTSSLESLPAWGGGKKRKEGKESNEPGALSSKGKKKAYKKKEDRTAFSNAICLLEKEILRIAMAWGKGTKDSKNIIQFSAGGEGNADPPSF